MSVGSEHDILKLRLLLSFLKVEELPHTVGNLAKTLGATKQRVSRILMELEAEGLLDRSNPRAPELTKKGCEAAARFAERTEIAMNHLLFEGVSLEKAQQDAYLWAIYNTDETMDVIKSAAARCKAKYLLRDQPTFSGNVLCKALGDGVYHFNFVIYREHVRGGSNLSMANHGFTHPGILSVKNGQGSIHLHVVPIRAVSPVDGSPISGKVTGLKYFDSGEFISAELVGDAVTFPVSALNFVNIGENINQMLHGSVCLKMRCSVKEACMPESVAIFTMLL